MEIDYKKRKKEMIENVKLAIVPDVHARDFWREPVKDILDNSSVHIVFLGDYVDPYPFEWEKTDIDYKQKAFDTLKEIIALKKEYPNNITLLLGNHDCCYAYSKLVCDCRRDKARADEIRELFRDNHKLFDIAYESTVNDRHFILSHAGILKEWLKDWGYPVDDKINIIEYLNNLNQVSLGSENPSDMSFCHALGQCDYWRGGYNSCGSVVWVDIRNIIQEGKELYPEGLHIVGHTMTTGVPIITDNIALIDCQKIFVIDEEGKLKEYEK